MNQQTIENSPLINRRTSLAMMVKGAGLAAAACATGVTRAKADHHKEDRFQWGVHHYSLKPLFDLGELDLASYPEFAAKVLGAPGIEIAEELSWELFLNRDLCRKVRTEAERFGPGVHAILCDGKKAVDAPDSRAREAAIDHHVKVAIMGAAVGARFLRLRAVSANPDQPGNAERQLEYAISGINQLRSKIPGSGPEILVENIAGHSRNPDWLVQLSKETGVGLIADFANFDGDIYEGMEKILPFTKAVCTKSWKFNESGDETTIDYKKMGTLIRNSNFHGTISIEYIDEKPTSVSGVTQTIKLLKKHL